jgi:hypothetical protein
MKPVRENSLSCLHTLIRRLEIIILIEKSVTKITNASYWKSGDKPWSISLNGNALSHKQEQALKLVTISKILESQHHFHHSLMCNTTVVDHFNFLGITITDGSVKFTAKAPTIAIWIS